MVNEPINIYFYEIFLETQAGAPVTNPTGTLLAATDDRSRQRERLSEVPFFINGLILCTASSGSGALRSVAQDFLS